MRRADIDAICASAAIKEIAAFDARVRKLAIESLTVKDFEVPDCL